MKSIRKNTLKVLMMVLLFCPAVFADGDMGGGGLADTGNPTNTTKTIRIAEDGDMGGGGRVSSTGFFQAAFDSIYEFIDEMI